MKTYNTVVTSKEVKTLENVVARSPYECIELGKGRFGFMDNERGDIRNYFCDTLGYECSNYEAFDFEYFDEPQNVKPSKPNHKTHLQGLGDVPAIKAGELKEGDIIVCNYGYTQTVTRIIKETAKSIFVEIRSDESGKLYETRYLKSRLVAIKERESVALPEPPKEINITDALDEMSGTQDSEPVKLYNTSFGIGTSKYVVNFHDGIKRHNDGSRFYDIRIFSNKKEMVKFIKELEKEGYKLDTFFNESESEKEENQESDRIAFAKASKSFIQEWRANNPYPGSDHLDEFNAKFNRDYSEFANKYGVSSYMVPNPYPIERGEYKETALDRKKKAADILVESIDGNWYTIRLNREIELKSKRVKRYDNGCIAVPESVYNKLQSKYNVMCNF